mmetsp:Transcript_51394/g.75199  ORF Transcript_51394/g.75199 Transcript_51394/m.75199 type:complete len:164 (+) Transcript_51394:72-563(+)
MATGLSSCNLILGGIAGIYGWSVSAKRVFGANCLAASGMSFFGFRHWQWRAEVLYLLPTLLAACMLVLLHVARLRRGNMHRKEASSFLRMVLVGGIPMSLGPLLDQGMCVLFRDLRVGVGHMVFGGSAAVFCCMVPWLCAVQDATSRTSSLSHGFGPRRSKRV